MCVCDGQFVCQSFNFAKYLSEQRGVNYTHMSAIMASSPSSCLTAAAVLWGLVAVSGDITTPCSWWNCGDDVRTTTMAPGKPGVSAACTKCLQQAAKPGDCSVYCATTTTTPVCDPYATPPVARPVQDLSTEEKLNLVKAFKMMKNTPVSYTHLTLPTKRIV